ncbi:MAG: hypothetical protein QOE13_1605 [Gaiellaceae bacterium]|nr:hypothetical protein [Gaiellaceae bacterium]
MREKCARVLAAALMTGAIGFALAMPAFVGTTHDETRPLTAPPSSLQRSVHVVASAPSRPAGAARLPRGPVRLVVDRTSRRVSNPSFSRTPRPKPSPRPAPKPSPTPSPQPSPQPTPQPSPQPTPAPDTRDLAANTPPAPAAPPPSTPGPGSGHGHGNGNGNGHEPGHEPAVPPPTDEHPTNGGEKDHGHDNGKGNGNGKNDDNGRKG